MRYIVLVLVLASSINSIFADNIAKFDPISRPERIRHKERAITLKPEYRQLRLTAFPKSGSTIPELAGIVVLCSHPAEFEDFHLNHNQLAQIKKVIAAIKEDKLQRSKRLFVGSLSSFNRRNENININKLIFYIVKKALLDDNKELRHFAEKLRHTRMNKSELVDHLSSLLVSDKECRVRNACSANLQRMISQDLQNTRNKLSQSNKLYQKQSLELQSSIQRNQQTMQAISNVSKMLHDTAMAIIRKMN